MQMSLRFQKMVTISMFVVGIALILYPLFRGQQLDNGSDTLLAKPTSSPEDHPSYNREVITSETETLEPAN